MAKKALLVGCNYPGKKAELHGCINDVNRIHRCLVQRFGFAESDITVLIDTDRRYTQPTGANIKRALNELVAASQPGDILFFHYSGHGVRLPAETGEDDDTGYDECIVPCDMNLITDDDFREIVDKVPQGVTFTLISDSCHSGGLINNAKEQIGESTIHHRTEGGGGAGKRGGLGGAIRGFLAETIQGALHDRGLDIDLGAHGRYKHEDENYQRVAYEGDGYVKSRALPISTLIEMLKQESGKEDVDVGSIRPTLFDMFGADSSSKVKKFVKVLLQNMNSSSGSEGNGHGLLGAVGALAQQFLKHKLEEVGDSHEYFKPALDTPVSEDHEAYAGSQAKVREMSILVSGCQSDQTSADANPSGNTQEAYGAMSNALQTVLSRTEGPITNHQLVTEARQLLKQQGFSQRPGLYCSDENAHATFIC